MRLKCQWNDRINWTQFRESGLKYFHIKLHFLPVEIVIFRKNPYFKIVQYLYIFPFRKQYVKVLLQVLHQPIDHVLKDIHTIASTLMMVSEDSGKFQEPEFSSISRLNALI